MIVVNRDDDYLRARALSFADQYKLKQDVEQLFELRVGMQKSKKQRQEMRSVRARRIEKTHFVSIPMGQDIVTIPEGVREVDFEFSWPLDRANFWLSSLFGPRRIKGRGWRFHYGIDMAAVKGNPVKAAGSGIVLQSCYSGGYGNCIIIAHNHKYKTRYAHLNTLRVKAGQKVQRGEIIGTVGDTGLVVSKKGRSAAHLHFEVYRFNKHVNPLSVLA